MKIAERGTSMIETTIVLLLALTVIFGIVEMGRGLFSYHAVSNAARLATRYAIVHGSNCIPSGCTATKESIESYIRSATPGVNSRTLNVSSVTWGGTALNPSQGCGPGANENPGCTVTVTVTYPFTFMVVSFGPGYQMSSSSQMVVSN